MQHAHNGEQVEIYQDDAGDWRWSLTAGNGKIIGASTEGYTDRRDCLVNFRIVTRRELDVRPRGGFKSDTR